MKRRKRRFHASNIPMYNPTSLCVLSPTESTFRRNATINREVLIDQPCVFFLHIFATIVEKPVLEVFLILIPSFYYLTLLFESISWSDCARKGERQRGCFPALDTLGCELHNLRNLRVVPRFVGDVEGHGVPFFQMHALHPRTPPANATLQRPFWPQAIKKDFLVG